MTDFAFAFPLKHMKFETKNVNFAGEPLEASVNLQSCLPSQNHCDALCAVGI